MRSALLITTLVASALAGPTGVRESCARHCSQDNIFSYQQGRSYEYEYTVTTTTKILQDTDNEAEVKIKSHAHIDVLAPCEYTLRLTQVTLDGSSHSDELAAALTRSNLRFSFQDGHVEELCAAETEEAWVLNFKRGVLSAFQTSRTDPGKHEVHETDVLGMCLTRYDNKIIDGDVLMVARRKEVSSCSRRGDITSYLSSAYTTDSPVQSLPLLDSDNICLQTVEGGILVDTTCTDTHSFTPFRNDRGAYTNVKTSLKLVARDGPAITPVEQSFVRKTPVFETVTEATTNGQVEAVTALLSQLDEAAREEVRPQAPELFTRLVVMLRGLDYPVLSRVYAATTETHSRKFLVDAMPLVGTAAAAGLVRDMYANGDLTSDEVDAWFASLAYLKNPTSDIFTAIAPMLDSEPSQAALLGTSALVNTFCKSHGACGDDSGVQQVMRRVEAQLGSGCRAVNEEQKERILVALRALGNAGRWVNAAPVLRRCFTEDNDMEVRVAAVEAWRHTPCEYDRSSLLDAYLDQEQDPEVRIAAYLSAMTCPTPAVVTAVQDRLTSEGVNQVGSFVWTHLANLQESAAPGKEWARVLLGEEMLANKFSTEALKFSRNYESSFFMNELNLGAAVESNVIFSSKSYLPRSAMLNLTLDLFGESVNLFEVGGRIEGFETYLERLFGPGGYFPEETVAAALQGLRHRKPEAEATTLEQFLEDVTDEPRGSYYLRLFGNDVHYRRFHGVGGRQAGPSPLDLLMEMARGGNVDYTKSYQLLDTHLSVPTVAGLPLTLGAKSSATLGLRMDGSFQAASLTDMRIEGHVRPSAAVTVDGVMLVDAHVTRAGVRVSSTLHTSTALEGKVTVNGGVLVDVAFNTPRQVMEIVDYDTKFFLVQDGEEQERPQDLPVSLVCTQGYTGLALCQEVSAQPYALLPTTMRLYLRKTDTQTGYTFRFTKSANEVAVVFNNPEAARSRRLALTLHAEDNKLLLDADSFLGRVEARGEYLWARNKKFAKVDVLAGGSKFNLDAGLTTSSGGEMRVAPYLQVTVGEMESLNTKAELVANPRQHSYSADLFFAIMGDPTTLKVFYDGATTTKNFGIELKSSKVDGTLDGKVDTDAETVKINTDVYYKINPTEKRHFSYTLVLGREREGDATTYSSKLDITLPSRDNLIQMEYKGKISPSELNCELMYQDGIIDMTAKEEWLHTYENGVRRIKGHLTAKSDYMELEQTANTEMVFDSNTIYIKSVMDRTRGLDAGVHTLLIDLKRDPGTSLAGLVKFDSPVGTFTSSAEFAKENPGHYSAKVEASAGSPARGDLPLVNARATLRDNSRPGNFDITAEASVKAGAFVDMSLTSLVYGDPQKAKVDLQTKFNMQEYGLKIDATRTSVFIDANVLKHVVVNANIDHQGPEKILLIGVEFDKETNPDNEFKIEGKIERNAVTAAFKFLDKEVSTVGRLVPHGVEAEVSWSPGQRANASLQYTGGSAPSLAAMLETSVPGWEKQSVDVSASLQDNTATCRASATWRNSQQASLAVVGRLPGGGAVHAEVAFSSTIAGAERLSLTLDHAMNGAAITSSLQGAWNDRQLNGSFQLTPTSTGLNGRAIFTSPFTQAFEAVLSHQLQAATLDSSLLVTYGSTQLARATAAGRLSLAREHDVDLTVKLATALAAEGEAEASVKYSLDEAALHLVLDGKAGQRKMMLNVNGEKTVTAEKTTISGDLRFLTPFTQPLTASLSHNHDGRRFTSQFEITRFWSTLNYGSLKMHAEGHFLSEKDVNLSAYISSPETKGSFSFVHKIEANKLSTVAKVYANRELISASVNGTFDAAARLLSLEGDVTSSFEGLDVRATVDSRREGDTQKTQVILTRGEQTATLIHALTAADALNWENTFTLNEHYSLKNKMARVGGEYKAQIEAVWGEQRLAVDGRVVPTLSAETRRLDAQLEITSPWEYLQPKVDITFEQKPHGETTILAEVEYKPGRKVVASTTNIYNHEGTFISAGSLSTPFWQPLSYDLNLALRPDMRLVLALARGDFTTVRLEGDYQPGRGSFQFNLATRSLQHPLGVEGSYDAGTSQSSAGLAFIYGHKYEAKTAFSGSVFDGGLELSLREYYKAGQAWSIAHQLDGRWQHSLAAAPYSIDAELQVDGNECTVAVTLDEASFTSRMAVNGHEGSLAARWLLQPTSGNLSLLVQFPNDFDVEVNDFNVAVAFDTVAREAQFKVKGGTEEVDLLAKMEDDTFVFEGKTPFDGWETLGASLFVSSTAVNAHAFRNERRIEVTGTQHFRPAKGKLELLVTTPYAGFETISFNASYNFLSENKTVKLKTVYGTAEIFAKGVVNIGDPLAPQVILNVSTPFTELRTMRATAEWNLNSATKSAAAKAVYNEREFSWSLVGTLQGGTQRLTSRVTTPFPGWSQAALEASIAVSEAPYEVRVTVQKEGVTQDFRGRLMLDNNAVHGEVTTPIPGWETVELDGSYTRRHNTFTAAVRATCGQHTFEVNTDILFDTLNPKLKVEVTTPFAQATNLKLDVEGSLAGQQQTLNVILGRNDATFSAEATVKLQNKTGFLTLRLRSPVPGFTSLEVEGSYDLLGDVKRSELNVTKEGQRQHFAVDATLDDNHVVLDVATPFPGFQVMKMDADYSSAAPGQHLVVASFLKDRETYNFRGDVEVRGTSVVVRLATPIEAISRVLLDARYQMLRDACQGSIRFERNSDVFEVSAKCGLTPAACNLSVEAATPIADWNNLALHLSYSVEPNRLTAEASVQRNDFHKKVSVKAAYVPEQGSLVVLTPVADWEELRAEYVLSVKGGSEANALITVSRNEQEFTFSAYGRYMQGESIALRFQTPFKGYEEASLQASINAASSSAKANLQVGAYTFSANGSYTLGNMFLEVATPFPALRFGSVAVKHATTSRGLEASLTVVHNENNYFVTVEASKAPRSAVVALQAKTPIAALPNATLKLKYNLDDMNDLLTAQLTNGENTYGLELGAELQEKLAILRVQATTPFRGWTQVKFEGKVDLMQDDKVLELVVESEGSVKAITVHGKLIGSTLDFDLRTPFPGLNRVNMSGSLDRVRRSVEFQMMNDVGEASILASFNSVKFLLKTPFARMAEVSFEIRKEGDAYYGTWKRNDNYLTLEYVRDPAQSTVTVEIKSELQGWEFLALTGRLDSQTEQAYASGQIKEHKVELAISGTRDINRRTRNYTLDLKTPYDNYQHVTGELRFSPRKRTIKVESNSSPFKIDVKSSRRTGLQAELFVPNPTQNTELNADLKATGGSLDFSSRFPVLRSLNYRYAINMGSEVEVTQNLKINELEVFTMEFKANAQTNHLHLDIHGRRTGRHLNLHIHREGFDVFNVILKREVTIGGRTTEKQLSIEMHGSGNLPQQGTIHAVYTNSFEPEPRTATIHAEIDRTASPKTVKLEVTLPGSKLYVFDIQYNIDLHAPAKGDFQVRITTPDRRAAPWKNFSGSWDVQNRDDAKLEFELAGRRYTAEGKLGLRESDLVAKAVGEPDRFFLQWRFFRNGDHRDYFIKVGPEASYRMLKLKGTINGITSGDIEVGFKASFQPHEFEFTDSWERSRPGSFSSRGTFSYGQYTGTHNFQLSRDAASRSATFQFNAESNHPNYRRIVLNGNYDVLNKLVFKVEATVNDRVSKIDINISDLKSCHSLNSIEASIPILPPQYRTFQMTLKHDFRSNDNRYIIAEAKAGSQDSHFKANWTRSDNNRVLEGSLDISSIFLGQINVGMEYDVSNYNDAHAKVNYKRVTVGGTERKVDATWTRKRTADPADRLEVDISLDTTFERLQHYRVYFTADFSQLFTLNGGLDFNDRQITIKMDVGNNAIQMEITTPYAGFESIKGTINYNFSDKTQSVTLHYELGSQQVDLELALNKKSKKKGDLTLSLTTPFEVLRILKIEASWNKRQATVEYLRNDVRVSMTGTAQLEANNSEFNLSFTDPSGKAVSIAAAYDVEAFIAGTGTSPAKLAALAIDIEDTKIRFEINGFRNSSSERLYVEVHGESSFERVRNLHLKLDFEKVNTQQRDGTFEFRFNDFVFEMYYHFERYEDGYYFKSRIESSLTPLPALVFGVGRRGPERIFTLGYGAERELTFSIKAKNNFRDGFSGSVDIPNFGYDGVQYDVTYSFPSNDELKIELKAELGSSEHLEAVFDYNSDGVKARLTSPFTGEHSARVRRSVTADGFFSEVGFDDYNLRLRGDFKEGDIKRGLVLEADVLGRKFLLNYMLQCDGWRYSTGNLVLETPFRGWEKMGGIYTFSNIDNRLVARAEAFIPFFLTIPRVTAAADLNLNNQGVEGEVTLNVAGEEFRLRSSLTGHLEDGLQGTVVLETPFHGLPRLEVAGKVKSPSPASLEADLKITHLYNAYEVDFSYELAAQKKVALHINDNYLTAEGALGQGRFTANVDTLWAGVRRQVAVDTRYSLLEDLEGSVTAVLGEQRHAVQGMLSVTGTRVRGEVSLDSSLINGVRKLEFNVTAPGAALEQASLSVTLTAAQVHAFSLDLDRRAGITVTAKIDTPAFPSTTATLELTWPRAAFTVTTPAATHTAAVSWRQTRKMPADHVITAELDTPLLAQRYALSVVAGGTRAKAVLKAELTVGGVAHTLEANTFVQAATGGFAVAVQTPFQNIQKAALSGLLDMAAGVKVEAVASMAEVSNAFLFVYSAEKGTVLAEAESPYIPTGLLRATAEITTGQDTSLQVALMNARNVISGRLDIKCTSADDVTVRATLSTPLEALKTVNAFIRYERSDVTHMVFSLDHPITFRADVRFSNADDKFLGNVTVKTSIATLEYVAADVEIPLTEFAPRASLTLPKSKYGFQANYSTEGYAKKAAATLFIDDQTHNASVSFRSKAPYELAYKYNILDCDGAFHLRTDSSFLSLLM